MSNLKKNITGRHGHNIPTNSGLIDITYDVLVNAREMARVDPLSAQVIFGIDSTMSATLANMSFEQIRRSALAGIFCFQLRLSQEFADQLAALDATQLDVFLNVIGDIEPGGLFEPEFL